MEKANYPITVLCEAVGVSRAGYYEWQRRQTCDRERSNETIVTHIRAIHAEHKQRYGSPRMTDELKAKGINVNRKRVERLMREKGIAAIFPRKYRKTTDSEHQHAVAPNLLGQKFQAASRDRVWVGDISVLQKAA